MQGLSANQIAGVDAFEPWDLPLDCPLVITRDNAAQLHR